MLPQRDLLAQLMHDLCIFVCSHTCTSDTYSILSVEVCSVDTKNEISFA